MTITLAAVLGSFSLVDMTVSHQSTVDSRMAFDSASCTLLVTTDDFEETETNDRIGPYAPSIFLYRVDKTTRAAWSAAGSLEGRGPSRDQGPDRENECSGCNSCSTGGYAKLISTMIGTEPMKKGADEERPY